MATITTSQRQSLAGAFARRFGHTPGLSFASISETRVRATRTDGTWIEGDFTRTRMRVTALHDASTVAPDAVPALIAPAPRHLAPAAAAAFRKAYNGNANFMTPHLEGFAKVGPFAVEVSTGDGIRFDRNAPAPTLWGVTVVGMASAQPIHKLSRVLTTRDAALRYLGKLAHLGDYRAGRRVLVQGCRDLRAMLATAETPATWARLTITREALATLRNRYSITIDRFGLDAYDHDAPEAHTPTVGDMHAAARRVSRDQPHA